uniref:Transposase n=2 Tax=Bursaphelenchus xylophilus TaxID=6326 RepID=A0A1I7SNK5_BURXY
TVSDHKMNMHKSPWWSKQNTFEPTPTEVGDLRLLTTPAH